MPAAREPWYRTSWRRNLVDMHLEDWDERFLSAFNPAAYVGLLKTARVQSAMVYANSHVGYCYWPTASGEMHRRLGGRDTLGELVERCHREGIEVILYYSLIFNNWAYGRHPEWRARTVDGAASRDPGVVVLGTTEGRYGICCPNAGGYREFVRRQVDELLDRTDAEGIFFDMTFWPFVCYCASCRERFRREAGGEPPESIDWSDERWLAFQRMREQWLAEFAAFATGLVRARRPAMTVAHNSSTLPFDWVAGTSTALIPSNDYLGGDFYGSLLHQSFVCKLFHSLTPAHPFEYMTSRCFPDLRHHTTLKQPALLELQAAIALAHGGAFFFIDALDPAGTQDRRVYEAMGRLFAATAELEPHLGGELCREAAVYFCMRSKIDRDDNGRRVGSSSSRVPHLDAVLGACGVLKEAHVPFGIVGAPNLRDLDRGLVLILSDAPLLDETEAAAISDWVLAGGSLLVGGQAPPPILERLLNLRASGTTRERFTYIAPTALGAALMPEASAAWPLTVNGPQVLAAAPPDAEVLAAITLPYTDPLDRSRFASIHSNPPGVATAHPAIVRRAAGKGTVTWCSFPLEKSADEASRGVFLRLVLAMRGGPASVRTVAPPAVETVVLLQRERSRMLVVLLNEQELLPPVAAHGVRVALREGGRRMEEAVLLPHGKRLAIRHEDGYAEIEAPPFELSSFIAVSYVEPEQGGKEASRAAT